MRQHMWYIFTTKYEIVKPEIDFAIIATNARHRYSAYMDAISKFKIKYIIFEKFYFKNLDHLDLVADSLNLNGIKAW